METNVLYKLSKFRNVLLPTFYSPPPAARAFAVAFTHHRHWPLKKLAPVLAQPHVKPQGQAALKYHSVHRQITRQMIKLTEKNAAGCVRHESG